VFQILKKRETYVTQSKQQYIESVRSNSAYPTYRGFIGTIALLGYLLAGFSGLSALISGLMSMRSSFMLGVAILVMGGISAAMLFLLARFFNEAALILVDIGDSVAEANLMARSGRTEQMAAH
jgi:hypothetical protein